MKKHNTPFNNKLLNLIIAALLVLILGACQSAVNLLYGPDLTPDQLRDLVYQDGYSAGNIRASVALQRLKDKMTAAGATDKQIDAAKVALLDDILTRCRLVRNSANPMAVVNQVFYRKMIERDADETLQRQLMRMAGQRILTRVGIRVVGDKAFEAVDFDRALWNHGVDAYTKAVTEIRQTLRPPAA